MKERIARTYIADDGKEFKRKADACRHDAELYVRTTARSSSERRTLVAMMRNYT